MIKTELQWYTPAEMKPDKFKEIMVYCEDGNDKSFDFNAYHSGIDFCFCSGSYYAKVYLWAYSPTINQIVEGE